jgi:hypothetical protein
LSYSPTRIAEWRDALRHFAGSAQMAKLREQVKKGSIRYFSAVSIPEGVDCH